jgi:uncharacterized OB-fold protein
MAKTRVPAVGAEGWFTEDPPELTGVRCSRCATVAFPPTVRFCPNPGCAGGADDLAPTGLGSTGVIWSYTDARYPPPPPYVVRTEPYEPVALAAVAVDGADLVVLGQLVDGVAVDQLAVGQPVELAIAPLFEDDDHEYVMWRWRPVDRSATGMTTAALGRTETDGSGR